MLIFPQISPSQQKRVYLSDLQKMDVRKGSKVQACVMEFKDPGNFFIQIQTVEIMESLRKVTLDLQNTYANSGNHTPYLPEKGEVCAAKYSQDQNWYRCLVWSLDPTIKTANVFYIDFGNEEEVNLGSIKPLSVNIDPIAPCALQCQVAAVAAPFNLWSEECCIAVKRLLPMKSSLVTVVDLLEDNTVFAVDFTLTAIGKQLGEFLLEQGYAVEPNDGKNSPREQDINCILNAALENFKKAGGKNGTGEMPLPEPLTLCVGDTFPAVVTHVESPEEFIFQKLDNMSAIQELQVSLREHCMQTAASEDFRPAPGAVCCSQFTEDNQWYRAVVRGYSSEDRVCVGYIDYGNSEDLEVNRLRPADAALLKLPMQAIPCALAGIKPVSEVWDSEAVQLMKTIVSNKFLKAKIIGKKDIKALVQLADECSDPQTNVAHMMVEMGYALSEEKMETKTDVTSDTQDSIGAVPPVEKLEWTSAELPNNRTVDVVVTVTNSPREFYCQLYNVEDLHRLSELSADLSRYCPTANATFTPVVAEPCCAIFPGDGAWYRGMVQDVSPNGKAVVFFGDYGNTSEVAVDKLCPILPKYLKLPFQAVKCWLAGDERMPREWTKDASRRFQQLTAAVQLQAKVLCTSERGSGIELLRDGQSIGDILTAEEMSICKTTTVSAPPVTTAAPIPEPRDRKICLLPDPRLRLQIVLNSLPLSVTSFTHLFLKHFNAWEQCLEIVKSSFANNCNHSPITIQYLKCSAIFQDVSVSDKNWYRAIVLEATDSEATVVYADYGNTEKVPFSRILPITRKHLELPFHTIQCRLSGKRCTSFNGIFSASCRWGFRAPFK
ncbi:TDRD1 protein, partial [Amia calva]|nr:TDRD1 protein [Amia calva]